jgi:membrane-associated protease RseP (regulator of RpoE activity)
VVRELGQGPSLFRASVGVLAIEVHDVDGLVVAAVDDGGGAETAGVKPGDIIVAAGGAPVTSSAQLRLMVNAQQKGQALSFDVRSGTAAPRKVDLAVQAVPNVVSLSDRGLRANKLALEYAYLSSSLNDVLDEVAVRLNLAALSLRLRNRADATRELERVIKVVGDGKVTASLTDAITGTAHYLLGLAAEAGGDTAAAERAWKVAALSRGNLLVENGEPLKELAEAKLGQLVARAGTSR